MAERFQFNGTTPSPLLVIGSVAYDDVITPYGSGERILGGAAAYASIAASYFTPTRLVGVVGNDFSDQDRQRLANHDIDLEGLEVDPKGKTFFWKGQYFEHFKRRETRELRLNVFEHFEPKLPKSYKDSRYILLGNIDPEIQIRVLDQVKTDKKPFVLADTIDFWISTKHTELLQLLKRIDLFVIDYSEALLLTQENNAIKAGKKLCELGPKIVIIKKGEHGSMLFHPEGMFILPAYPVEEVRDPTGAGDSFAGSLMGYLAAHDSVDLATFKQAMTYANIVGGLTVEAFSCDRLESAGIATIQERQQALKALVSLE